MTGAEVQANYFTPFHYFVYLTAIFILMVVYYEWQWANKVRDYVKVIVVKSDGGTDTHYAPKDGNTVSITNPKTGTTKLWPITKLSTIDTLYPGDGFVPVFLQKQIRTTIVDEVDWEPLLNRGAYSEGVASPDVKRALQIIANSIADEKLKSTLLQLADGLKTAPTREMIASPAVLGNIAKEKISELAVTVAKDIMHPLEEAIKKLGRQVNPTVVYIGLGLVVILGVYTVYQLNQMANADVSSLANDIAVIKKALGIVK